VAADPVQRWRQLLAASDYASCSQTLSAADECHNIVSLINDVQAASGFGRHDIVDLAQRDGFTIIYGEATGRSRFFHRNFEAYISAVRRRRLDPEERKLDASKFVDLTASELVTAAWFRSGARVGRRSKASFAARAAWWCFPDDASDMWRFGGRAVCESGPHLVPGNLLVLMPRRDYAKTYHARYVNAREALERFLLRLVLLGRRSDAFRQFMAACRRLMRSPKISASSYVPAEQILSSAQTPRGPNAARMTPFFCHSWRAVRL
jgi:hypothetical protein